MTSIILIAVGIILIALNLNAVLRGKKSFRGQLDMRQNDMEDYKIEIGKIRKEFAETVFELQKEIKSLKEENKNNMDKMILYDRAGNKVIGDSSPKKHHQATEVKAEPKKHETKGVNNVKIDEVRNLLHKDMSIDEISKKTGIGKGEVLLIKELYIK